MEQSGTEQHQNRKGDEEQKRIEQSYQNIIKYTLNTKVKKNKI